MTLLNDRIIMHNMVKMISKVAARYAPSRILSYDPAHVLKSLQLASQSDKISRTLLQEELDLGEGSIKTLVKHLKMQDLVETSNAGMWMTAKGRNLYKKISETISAEMDLSKCSVTLGKFNHAILVKDMGDEVTTGIEQRDAAIKVGATGATTLIFQDGKFLMPDRKQDSLRKDIKLKENIIESLQPQENDVIIIASSENRKNADIAAKSAALYTISKHERH